MLRFTHTRLTRTRFIGTQAAASIAAATALSMTGAIAHLHGAQPPHDQRPPGAAATAGAAVGPAVFLVAALNGRNEIPTPGGPAVGDPDGQAVEVLRIMGDQISFAIRWTNLSAPAAGHIHAGAAGMTGPVRVPFFDTALPDNLTAATGSVTVNDAALLHSLTNDPTSFYVNLHTADFPGGAVRGQLHLATHPLDLNAVLRNGPIVGLLSGDQEVPEPSTVVGALAGHASAFIAARRSTVTFSFLWSGIGAPTNGHIHNGPVGTSGPVAVPLFTAPAGLPDSISGIAGVTANVNPALVRRINAKPNVWYANLHTAQFPGGAVRGQLFGAGDRDDPALDQSPFVASVVHGEQIYACTKQADGTFAFTQHNVRATLRGGIAHSFVVNDAGPPQWVAPDHSAVTGTLIAKTPHGTGNIAELDLSLTQHGASRGRLANAVEVQRLNTVGGLPPTGPCDPHTHPLAHTPYQADYLFLPQ